ncbi:SMP-30/gluconolactonase/LRE family protein [Niabella insulamsoli]|uniref:SMP-30/gluconolactonase/LRE family protein n=1 Tax=Niabella insulamsoli TaxID=3144874 RepID=UPI0031FCAE98
MKILLACIASITGIALAAQPPLLFDSLGIVAPHARLKKISDQFSFTEGPAADKRGNVYFTDQPNNTIWFFDAKKGSLRLFKKEAGRANGLYLDAKGNIIACADEHNELWQVDPKGRVKILLSNVNGKKLNGPNDLWVDGAGGIYFTDPYYQRNYWARKAPEIERQNVYYWAQGQQVRLVDSNLVKPNGIVGRGSTLYVADIGDSKTYKYMIRENGTLTDRTLFVTQGSDGMTLDAAGNLYLTGKGVTVYNAAGVKIAHIPVPEKWVANICFAGKKKNILFITAGTSIYTLEMATRGDGVPR